jgi:hypothetical protein
MQLLLPDFWLVEASNVLWLQVRRKIFTPDEALEGLSVLEAVVVADRGFMRDMRRHPDAAVAGMLISLEELSVTD